MCWHFPGKTDEMRLYVNHELNSNDFNSLLYHSLCMIGQERFTWMTRVYYRDAKGCIIMFDLTNRQSFLNVSRWKEDLDAKVWLPDGSPIPCLLLASKVCKTQCGNHTHWWPRGVNIGLFRLDVSMLGSYLDPNFPKRLHISHHHQHLMLLSLLRTLGLRSDHKKGTNTTPWSRKY